MGSGGFFYTNIENLVLWARAEKIGHVVNICRGMMETWNAGMLGLAEWDLFLSRWQKSEHKIRPSSAFDSQYSIIPSFHYSTIALGL